MEIDPPGHCSCNPQKHYLIPSYWGGPLFNIRGSVNNPCTVPDADGRFVVYDRQPDIDALSSVVIPASWWIETVSVLEDLFLVDVATCDFCGNDVILDAEKWLGSVSTSSTHSDNNSYNNKKSSLTRLSSKTQQIIQSCPTLRIIQRCTF